MATFYTEANQRKRMELIFDNVKKGGYPTKNTLAKIIGCDASTIGRDINKMRNEENSYGVPLEFDQVKNGWYLTDTSYKFEALKMTEKEIFALFIVEQITQQYIGTQIFPTLQKIIKKIETSCMEDQGIFPIERFDNTLISKSKLIRPLEESVWETIVEAIRNHKTLKIKHASAYKKNNHKQFEPTVTSRTIVPAKILVNNGNWYLIAWDERKNDIRNFAISRIKDPEIQNKEVKPDSELGTIINKKIKELSQNQFGFFLNDESHDIELLFTPQRATYIMETDWPSEYTLPETIEEGESLTMKFKSNNLIEVTQWVLSMGEEVKVIEPQELKESVKNRLQKALEQY